MTVKPGDRTTITCGCVNEFTPANDWRCVAPCSDHAAVMAHSWVCETCEMGPLDNEGMRAVLAVPAAGEREADQRAAGLDYDPDVDRLVRVALVEHGPGDGAMLREPEFCRCGWRRYEGWPSHTEHRARVIAQRLLAAPAVPVGVQPEPAEEETPAETLLRDIFTDPAQRAVPVVHPEPGDRWEFDSEANAGYLRLSSGRVYVAKTRALHPAVNVDLTADGSIVGVEILFPGSVAAAVAAVRADLAAQIEARRVRAPLTQYGEGHNDGLDRAAALVRGPAAAVRSATKEDQ